MEHEMEQIDAPSEWERLEAVAMRGDHEFLVRSGARRVRTEPPFPDTPSDSGRGRDG